MSDAPSAEPTPIPSEPAPASLQPEASSSDLPEVPILTEPLSVPPPAPEPIEAVTEPVIPIIAAAEAVVEKPLLNPLQTTEPPPSSTIAEPPRSPNALDTSTLISAPSTTAGTPAPPLSASVIDTPASLPLPTPPVAPEPEVEQPTPSLPPLPTDAPLPPAPDAADEPPPSLPASAIPSAVATPTVISTEPESLAAPEQAVVDAPLPSEAEPVAPEPLPEAFPTPAGTTFDPVADAIAASAPAPEAAPAPEPAPAVAEASIEPIPETSDAMDIDADGEGEEESVPALAVSASTGSLKRAGEDLEAEDVKRVREEGVAAEAAAPVVAPIVLPPVTPSIAPAAVEAPAPSAPTDAGAPIPSQLTSDAITVATPVAPVDLSLIALPPRTLDPAGNPVPFPWEAYVESTPRDPGPTTPLTLTQHKHLLSAFNRLKKSPSAFAFQDPVDTVRFGIPHYHLIITRPMDLGLIETKLLASDPRGAPDPNNSKDKSRLGKWDTSKGSYNSVAEITRDVRQVFENTRRFNGASHIVSQGADPLEVIWEKALSTMPAENAAAPTTPGAVASPAGPSSAHARRQSISQVPMARRSPDSARPKRDIHPPPPRDIAYDGPTRKPKRRNDPQLAWAAKQIQNLEKTSKGFEMASPFLFSVEDIIKAIPDYIKVISQPIDLFMIKARLEEGVYEDISNLTADLQLLVNNAKKFNPPGDSVHIAAMHLEQWWNERLAHVPPKQEPREESEDPLAEDVPDEPEEEDEDVVRLRAAKEEREALDREIAELEARISSKPSAPKRKNKSGGAGAPRPSKGGSSRKYSTSKASPGTTNANGNGHAHGPKKPRKSKEPAAAAASYDNDEESEEEPVMTTVSTAQKQELADKIQTVDMSVLQEAISIIQSSTGLGGGGDEIELDMETLPPAVVLKLYNLVCRGIKGGGNAPKGRKNSKSKGSGNGASGGGGGGGGHHKKAKVGAGGGPARKHYNELEEQERIKQMEEQLNKFDRQQQQPQAGYGGDDYSSSEEESSDEE